MAKSLATEPDVRRYLACVLVDAMVQANEALCIPEFLRTKPMSPADWSRYKVASAGEAYNAHGGLGNLGPPGTDPATQAQLEDLTQRFKALQEMVEWNFRRPDGEDEVDSAGDS